MRNSFFAVSVIAAVIATAFAAVDASTQAGPIQPVSQFGCAQLPPADGRTTMVGPEDASRLPELIADASPGTTITLRDGVYRLGGAQLRFRKTGVTLRSASGDAAAVTIDGEYRSGATIAIGASDVTIAHITLTRAVDHLVHIVPEADEPVLRPRLYGLRLVDAGEQFVKVNSNAGRVAWVDAGRVECSTFTLTEAGRTNVESIGGTSCYTGGIDVHGGRDWVVRLNRFEDIYCRTGFLAEHAVHFWLGTRETLVENNTILNCARGIGFGLGSAGNARRYEDDRPAAEDFVGHRGGLIRNNVIYADVPEYDTGIGLEQARDVRVFHNTVFATPAATRAFSSIDARFANTRVEIRNNLVNNITERAGPVVTASHNVVGVTANAFVDAARRDFHLRADFSKAIDSAMPQDDAGLDMDGQPRGPRPDVGADERGDLPIRKLTGESHTSDHRKRA